MVSHGRGTTPGQPTTISSSALVGADVRPPTQRSGFVLRRAIVDTLITADADVITVFAPPGYGKTTVLAQWAREQIAPVAWLSLRRESVREGRLIELLGASLSAIGLLKADDVAFLTLLGDAEPSEAAGYLRGILEACGDPVLIVIDNGEFLRDSASLDVVRELVHQLDGVTRLALASHLRPKIGLPALRASGRLLEISAEQLAFGADEVEPLADELGLEPKMVADIVAATEGWPAATKLAAAAVGNGQADLGLREIETRRHLIEFVTSEVISHLPKRRRQFLTLVSPLDRLSGPLCDFVCGRTDSQRVLDSLERDTRLIRSRDADNSWFTMNPVLRDALRYELRRSDPEAEIELHARAAEWFEANDLPLEAIGHAAKAGQSEAFARLMGRLIKSHYTTGEVEDVLMWMDWLDQNLGLADYPRLAAIGALVHVQEGNALEAERWLAPASRGNPDRDAEAVSWLVRALSTKSGVDTMIRDVDTAVEVAGPGSRWLPAILATKGIAHIIDGDADKAEPCFIEAADLGEENHSAASVVLALGHRALLAIDRQEWDVADRMSNRAQALIKENSLDTYYATGPALIAAARCARYHNDIKAMQKLLARVARVRSRLGVAMPGESVFILLELAKAHLEASDIAGARAIVREAEEIALQRPDLGVLPAKVDAAKEGLAHMGPGKVSVPALTKAELRLLPFLATHLSFPEIGERLYVSRHTVKSQATSIYRKLNSSTRSEAVARAYDIGLLTR